MTLFVFMDSLPTDCWNPRPWCRDCDGTSATAVPLDDLLIQPVRTALRRDATIASDVVGTVDSALARWPTTAQVWSSAFPELGVDKLTSAFGAAHADWLDARKGATPSAFFRSLDRFFAALDDWAEEHRSQTVDLFGVCSTHLAPIKLTEFRPEIHPDGTLIIMWGGRVSAAYARGTWLKLLQGGEEPTPAYPA